MELVKELVKEGGKILLAVLDGLGGLPVKDGRTELELAKTPNLDALAKNSALGMHLPVDYGITPGSGPGHLALFGYDPVKYRIGRGVLEALGLGLEVDERSVAVRANYATVKYENGKPVVVDRRAGRLPTEENRRITRRLAEEIKEIDGVKVELAPGMEHRLAVVFRFPEPLEEGSDAVTDTDPQATGLSPLEPRPLKPQAERVARVAVKFLERVAELLKNEPKANFMLLRGFAQKPKLEPFSERYGLKAVCVAVYPMYRGLARLVGMETVEPKEPTLKGQIETLKELWDRYEFFFLHYKKTDSYGEDGNYEGKVKAIEEFDAHLPELLELKPAVLAVTGDHATPSVLKSHSWHPVPVLVHSPFVLGGYEAFNERTCLKGELGTFPGKKLMQLLLAHALRLKKFGA
ncbi:MAG: 2,3-bisphosphoglycerate-independent phosphoglycerate mutase [Aquificae bacterium]|nr:2,3-bisphosphoglycerate-independent phosphoglycerate mutase [Aquificota bacterium]